MSIKLQHCAVIAAPAERVWEALLGVGSWSEWNRTLSDPDGPLEPGRVVKMRLALGPIEMAMRQKITVVDGPRRLEWQSLNMPKRLMAVDRVFEIEPLEGGGVVLRQSESGISPVASAFIWLLKPWITAGYREIALALRERVEDGTISVDPSQVSSDTMVDRIADDLDQSCLETGSTVNSNTRTERNPERLVAIDPNAPHNGGVSVHPLDREAE